MLFSGHEYIIAAATMFTHFQHGGHEPEVVISHHLWHLPGPCKELFYLPHVINPMPTVCDNWLLIKLITKGANRK